MSRPHRLRSSENTASSSPCAIDLINRAHSRTHQRQQISSAASAYLICIRSESKSYSRGSDTTVGNVIGCVDCKLKLPTRRTTKNMLWEMDHSSLPLDAQWRAAEEELGQRIRVDRLLLVRSSSNSRSSNPMYKFAGVAQVHHL